MKRIRCIAVDDEPPALRQMSDYISKVPYLELLATFGSALETMQFLKENQVDLLFLDIRMEQLSGIELINLLNPKPKIILATAYDSYAIKAFDLEVEDYLLKPISFERFLRASERVYAALHPVEPQPPASQGDTHPSLSSTEADYLFVKTKAKIQRVDLDDILFVEGLKEYLIINTAKERIITLMNFQQLMDRLPQQRFCRVHKSFVVAMRKIDAIRKGSILIGEKVIPIGSSFRADFLKLVK